jgi:hypothetical protein
MKTKTPRLCARSLLAACAALWLAACGPGTGGTGTGESAPELDAFGAAAASVCAAPFADRLDCAAVAGAPAASPGAPAGTARVRYAEPAPLAGVVAVFEGDGVVLQVRCAGLDFAGTWGIDARHGARFFGGLLTAGSPQRTPATLQVLAAPDGLAVLLLDADDRVVAGPLALVRTPLEGGGAPPCR